MTLHPWIAQLLLVLAPTPRAHDGHEGHAPIVVPVERLVPRAALAPVRLAVDARAAFAPFTPAVRTRVDERWLFVESHGWPAHPMMAGIRSWQQQVPIPQDYTGDNAWRIPLAPRLADEPVSGRTALLRGAIALAANGVPIFNALNNRGEDAFLAGELDRWGGHCGRADDYHYHVAPLHLLETLGPEAPLGYALDGFPLHGLFEPARPESCPLGGTAPLDALNGHAGRRGDYHYHASLTYPYINGGVRGVVTVEDDQIEPQPRALAIRPALRALRGAVVTGHESRGAQSWSLAYTLEGAEQRIDYARLEDGRWRFEFVAPDGTKRLETYTAEERRGRGADEPARGPVRGGAAPELPWILAHAAELDSDEDGAVARAELLDEARAAFRAYDADHGGAIEPDERTGKVPRLPMGGFIDLHASELDGDGNGRITLQELEESSVRMFARSDRDGDGRLAGAELTTTPQEGRRAQAGPERRGREGGGNRGERAEEEDFHDEVPPHLWDIVLARPGADEITISVLATQALEGRIEYRSEREPRVRTSASAQLVPGTAHAFVLTGLAPDSGYTYRWQWKTAEGEWASSAQYRFHTWRPAGKPYTFTLTADSHLDANMQTATFEHTLARALSDGPDFHLDLGDTFMADKRRDFRAALPQYLAQRYWFGKLAHSTPLFLVLGNHDGEAGYLDDGPDGMARFCHALRTNLFPAPVPGGIYTGNAEPHPELGSLQDHYAFTWGDATHIVLDPFWYTRTRARGNDADGNWSRTLGKAQYDWLARTLAESRSRYVFVYLHHLVGGLGRDARGGAGAARSFEWGGQGATGTDEFAARRPGWSRPIHALLVEHQVSAVFHGHDHLYAHESLDGVVYQCVPQPGNTRGGTQSAEEYGYTSGTILGSPGHLRVLVSPDSARVEFVRSASGGSRREEGAARAEVAHAWTLLPREKARAFSSRPDPK